MNPIKRVGESAKSATKTVSAPRIGPAGKFNVPTIDETTQVFIHNKAKGDFHLPLLNAHPSAQEDAIKFEHNSVRKIEKALTSQQRFLDAIEQGFLEVFTTEEYTAFMQTQSLVKANETRKAATGNHKSGLPNNRAMAIQQIAMIDDQDMLQALYDEETRGSIMAAIEERLGELADTNFDD